MSTIPHSDHPSHQPSILPNNPSKGLVANIQTNLSLYTISALLILDSDGARVLAKYYTPPHQAAIGTGLVADLGVGAGGPGMGLSGLKEQKAFEKSIWEKVKRGGGESHFISAARQIPSPYFTFNRIKHSTFFNPYAPSGLALTNRRDPPPPSTYHLNPHNDRFNIHNRRTTLNFE
jgi:hypothetical protein